MRLGDLRRLIKEALGNAYKVLGVSPTASINHPSYTQVWDFVPEGVRRMVDDLVFGYVLQEWGQPGQRNVLSPDSNDREPIEQQTLKDLDGKDELSSHLQDAEKPDQGEDDEGPVGRQHRAEDFEFAPMSDPYAQDWHVIPTPRFSGGR